jgi:hypothetical protein
MNDGKMNDNEMKKLSHKVQCQRLQFEWYQFTQFVQRHHVVNPQQEYTKKLPQALSMHADGMISDWLVWSCFIFHVIIIGQSLFAVIINLKSVNCPINTSQK